MTTGGTLLNSSCWMCRSVPQIPVAMTSMSTWPGPGEGFGTLPRPTFSAPFAFFISPVIWSLLEVDSVMARIVGS